MGRIEADIALLSWLFGFRPCSGQEQFTLNTKYNILFYISSGLGPSINSQYFLSLFTSTQNRIIAVK